MTRLAKSRKLVISILALLIVSAPVFAQNDNRRTTIAITYPLDQTISVPFRGTTRLPRLKGDAKAVGGGAGDDLWRFVAAARERGGSCGDEREEQRGGVAEAHGA